MMAVSRRLIALVMGGWCFCSPVLAVQECLLPVSATEFRDRLDGLKGRVVLINFWATWCRPCLKELPVLRNLEQKYASQGFHLVTVSLDDPAEQEALVRPFLTKWLPGLHTLIHTDPDMGKIVSVVDPAWNEVLPTSYLLDNKGQVQRRFQGGKTASEFEEALLPLLAKPD